MTLNDVYNFNIFHYQCVCIVVLFFCLDSNQGNGECEVFFSFTQNITTRRERRKENCCYKNGRPVKDSFITVGKQ